jgi:hypothetical protein
MADPAGGGGAGTVLMTVFVGPRTGTVLVIVFPGSVTVRVAVVVAAGGADPEDGRPDCARLDGDHQVQAV